MQCPVYRTASAATWQVAYLANNLNPTLSLHGNMFILYAADHFVVMSSLPWLTDRVVTHESYVKILQDVDLCCSMLLMIT